MTIRNRIAVALTGLAALTACTAAATRQPSETYAAIITVAPGVEYQVASRASLSKCQQRIADVPHSYCEREAR